MMASRVFCSAIKCHNILSGLRRSVSSSIRTQTGTEITDSDIDLNDKLDPFARGQQLPKAFLNDVSPPLKRSFNLAAYVNHSKTLQELIKLGVSLYDIENTDELAAKHLVHQDFEKDCVGHIKFLLDHGLKQENLGVFITEFPRIFQTHIDDLQTRINYLESKGFSRSMLRKALNRSSAIISRSVKSIDHKLGQLQIEFKLKSDDINLILMLYPELVKLPETQFKMIKFVLYEEFGFEQSEVVKILRDLPKVLSIPRPNLVERLDFLHNVMGLTHQQLVQSPGIILGPKIDIDHRFNYLKKLQRNQFNPREPLYVPPRALYKISDVEFCEKYAKTTLDDYKMFIRNL